MKRTPLALAALFPVLLFGQDSLLYGVFPVIEGKVNYTKIFAVDSATKDQLFTKIKDWAVNSYKSQKATLQSEDKEAGYIAYKGFLPVVAKYTGGLLKGSAYAIHIYHTLKFYIKDGKVKIVFTDLEQVSHDFASNYISDHTGKPINSVPVEAWLDGIEKQSSKKQEKWRANNKEHAQVVDANIQILLNSIVEEISKKKSEFDF